MTTSSLRNDDRTADRPTLDRPTVGRVTPNGHEHGWRVESSHRSSIGRVCYVRCIECGVRRVDLQDRPDVPPAALSVPVQARRALDACRTSVERTVK